jgi:hypothetical protein
VITHLSCVIIRCDGGCPDRGWSGEDGEPHFTNETEALNYVVGPGGCGWTRLPDGRLLCGGCMEDAECAVTGHQMREWFTSPTNPAVQWRTCGHCGRNFEQRFIEMEGPL